MYQAKIYIDFHSPGVLHEATSGFEEPFDVLEEEVHDDGTLTFVVDTRGHRETFAGRIKDAPEVSEIDKLDDELLLIRKEAQGATVVIRQNHGKLNGIDKVHGTKRVFEVLFLRREDLRSMLTELQELGTVRLDSLVDMTEPSAVLSDRQYETVQMALEMGYFAWPRETDIETIADALDIAHSTALEHLRKGQRKLLERSLQIATARLNYRDRDFLLNP